MTGHILIVDETATNRIALRAVLVAARYRVAAAVPDQAFETALSRNIDLIIMSDADAVAPDADLLERFKADPRTARIPVLVLSAGRARDVNIAALRAGADDVTSRDGASRTLLARIRSHMRAADTAAALGQRERTVRDLGFAEPGAGFEPPARVALVSHDPDWARSWRDRVQEHIPHRIQPIGIDAALAASEGDAPADLFVIEAALAHPGEALGLLADLRSRPATRHAGIIVVHSPDDPQTATMALDLGANDLLEDGFHPEELALRLAGQLRRKRAGDKLRASVDEGLRLAVQDPLTGLFNRRYATTHVGRFLDSGAGARGYCVILADIDRFKAVNDTHGHATGDAVLCTVARQLRDNVRSMDMVARIGGEEFLIFLPDPDPEAAHSAALRLCRKIRENPLEFSDGRTPLAVTASFGVAMADPGEALEDVLDRADRAMYDAKAAGRDTVTMAGACAA